MTNFVKYFFSYHFIINFYVPFFNYFIKLFDFSRLFYIVVIVILISSINRPKTVTIYPSFLFHHKFLCVRCITLLSQICA